MGPWGDRESDMTKHRTGMGTYLALGSAPALSPRDLGLLAALGSRPVSTESVSHSIKDS